MTFSPPSPPPPAASAKVLIAGAGLAGLMLAIIFERAGITYEVFEQAKTVKPLGAAMGLNANILPALDQLGLLDDIMKISLPCLSMDMFHENMKRIGSFDLHEYKERSGLGHLVLPRPRLYDLMLSKVPAHKIHMNKKIILTQQDSRGVTIYCGDDTTYCGDILVGADGAYSSVRQNLYKEVADKGLLPHSDTESITQNYACMVGITTPQDPEKYPTLKDPYAHFDQVIGGQKDKPHSWASISTADNRICWGVVAQLKSSISQDEVRMNVEWGPDPDEKMDREFRNYVSPVGGRMGDLMDATPKHLISKIFFEEKIFETWHFGRTVLIGDACHKMNPSGGQSAVNALQDAVILANCLYDLESTTLKAVSTAFEDYRYQRYPHAKRTLENSKTVGSFMYGQTFMQRLKRTLVFGCMPKYFEREELLKTVLYRPHIVFLPMTENSRQYPILAQKPSKRYQAEQKRLAGAMAKKEAEGGNMQPSACVVA